MNEPSEVHHCCAVYRRKYLAIYAAQRSAAQCNTMQYDGRIFCQYMAIIEGNPIEPHGKAFTIVLLEF